MDVMSAVGVLNRLKDEGLTLWLRQGKIRYSPAEKLTPPLRALIETHRGDLVRAMARRPAGRPAIPSSPSQRPAHGLDRLVAPLGSTSLAKWQGDALVKPWQYKVTACIPHLETPEPLQLVIELLRLQTERPYILVIDTGSSRGVCERLEVLRSEDCEIHYLRAHGYTHSSGPVSTALDMATALCRTEYLYHTHSDVFAMRRDLLAWLAAQCNATCPAVGYQMSERSWASDLWQHCIGHQCAMFHVSTIRKEGLCWNLDYGTELAGWSGRPSANGWPDTETAFGLLMLKKGIPAKFIGTETNHVRTVDENVDHARSYTGRKVYCGTEDEDAMQSAMADARLRIAAWEAEASTVRSNI